MDLAGGSDPILQRSRKENGLKVISTALQIEHRIILFYSDGPDKTSGSAAFHFRFRR